MVYYDKSDDSIGRPLRRRAQEPEAGLDEEKVRYILEVADEFPRFTPDEVYATIHHERRRYDITIGMVRLTLDGRSRSSVQRGFGL